MLRTDAQFRLIEILQRILILRLARLSADRDHRRVLRKRAQAHNARKFRAQARDDLVGAGRARNDEQAAARPVAGVFELDDEQADIGAGARAAEAHDRHDVIDARVGLDDSSGFLLIHRHLREGCAVGCFGRHPDLAGVLAGQEILFQHHEEAHRRQQACDETRKNELAMVHAPSERTAIERMHAIETVLAPVVKAAMLGAARAPQEAAAEHGRKRQRDYSRSSDGNDDRDCEFVKQPADQATHEHDRYEHGRKRHRHRKDCESDLGRTCECGIVRVLTILDMARDVFEHDDGVVDDESY